MTPKKVENVARLSRQQGVDGCNSGVSVQQLLLQCSDLTASSSELLSAVRVGAKIAAGRLQSFAAGIQLLVDVIASTQGIFLARPSFAQLAFHLSQLSQCGHELYLATSRSRLGKTKSSCRSKWQ
ncbi:hypothetical protein ATCC90586_006412 [Pythium insidiosum]|nr:hypothetical protein ATCC90586_006412 [Pythium insidiosum]